MREALPKLPRSRRARPQTFVLWLLFLGLMISLGANLRQDREISGLALDLSTLRQQSEKDIADLRQAQATSLEQDLLRLDQLTTQVEKANEEDREQIAAAANKTRSDLAKTVEQRHEEMIDAISDLRSDLRSVETPKPSPFANSAKPADPPQMQQFASSTSPVSAKTRVLPLDSSSNNPVLQQDATPSTAPKKRFWSRLNPFHRNKNKQDTASGDPAQ